MKETRFDGSSPSTGPAGKLIFVTGAGRGIGKAIALKLADAGYAVAGCARSRAELEQVRHESGDRLRIASVDVSVPSQLEAWIDRELEGGELPWGLVTAAGIYGPIGSFVDTSWDEWRRAIEVNLYGTAIAAKTFCRVLIQRGVPGRVVLLSGGGATQPLPNFSSYCAAKSAVVRFGETLAYELKPHAITVNSIAPGAINTQLLSEVLEAGPEKAGKQMYEKALQQKESGGQSPLRAAELACYLMQESSAFVTGRLISAIWDSWESFTARSSQLADEKMYTLRRQVPPDA